MRCRTVPFTAVSELHAEIEELPQSDRLSEVGYVGTDFSCRFVHVNDGLVPPILAAHTLGQIAAEGTRFLDHEL